MKIITRATAPDGMEYRLEDWSYMSPLAKKNATIGFYPVAQNNVYRKERPRMYPYPKKGERFRASLDFPSEAAAREAFDSIVNGEKSVLQYLEYCTPTFAYSTEDFVYALAG